MAHQTAVQFLEPLLIEKIRVLSEKRRHEIISLIEKSKQIEKERSKSDFIAGMEFIAVDPSRYEEDAEKYYNEKYGTADGSSETNSGIKEFQKFPNG
jgi:hypothetical protein